MKKGVNKDVITAFSIAFIYVTIGTIELFSELKIGNAADKKT